MSSPLRLQVSWLMKRRGGKHLTVNNFSMHKYLSHFYVHAPAREREREREKTSKGDANFFIVFSINIFIAPHKLIKALAFVLYAIPCPRVSIFHFVAALSNYLHVNSVYFVKGLSDWLESAHKVCEVIII